MSNSPFFYSSQSVLTFLDTCVNGAYLTVANGEHRVRKRFVILVWTYDKGEDCSLYNNNKGTLR